MDPEKMQTGRRAKDPRRLHPETFTRSAPSTQETKHAQRIRRRSGRPAAATGYTPRIRGKPLERENTRQGIEHHTGRQTALKSAYI